MHHFASAQIRTCALCANCTIDLGERDWSDVTPGEQGFAVCDAQAEDFPDPGEGQIDLVQMAKVGSSCPSFRLLVLQ